MKKFISVFSVIIILFTSNFVYSQITVYTPHCDTLLWSKISWAVYYRVQVTHNFIFNDIDTSHLPDTLYVAHLGLVPGMAYYMRVRAYSQTDSSNWSDQFYFIWHPAPPLPPAYLGLFDTSSVNARLVWSKVSGAVSYGLQIALDPQFGSIVINANNLLDTFFIVGDTLNTNTLYYLRLKCNSYCSGGNWSNVYTFTIPSPLTMRKIYERTPGKFELYQNYPNPFNPSTKIKFEIPGLPLINEAGGICIRLTIYDILGNEVTTLVNATLQPGTYEVEWVTSNFPSGVYFYRIVAWDSYVGTNYFSPGKKMLLVK